MRLVHYALIAFCALALAGCGINDVPTKGEAAKAAWAEVQNQYQRRSDLVPNLVETVRGYAKQEEKVLTEVTQARASATKVTLDPTTFSDPAKFQEFQAVQDRLSGALGRLLVTVERYPDLKSNQNFLALQSQLEGTENRIAVARRDYIQAVQGYNLEFTTIPDKWVASLLYGSSKPLPAFTAPPEAQTVPKVTFQ